MEGVGGGSPSQMLPSLPSVPHLCNLSLLRQTPPPSAADLYFSSRLLLYAFIKSTFRDGGSAQMPFFKSKVALGVCIFFLFL